MAEATALRIEQFAREPMDNKLVTEVAGVGRVAKMKLNGKGIIRAADLYEKLRKLRFDESRFKDWLLKICPGARAGVIFKSLITWQEQNEPAPSTSRGGRPTAPRQRRSVPSNSNLQPQGTNSHHHPTNTDPFILLISDLLPNIAPDLRTEYMGKILKITQDYETITRNRQADVQMPPPPPPA